MPVRSPGAGFVALSAAATAAAYGVSAAPAWAAPTFASTPFTLGVASGDPLPDGVVLWTRLAPEPLAPDGLGGMPNKQVEVTWEVGQRPVLPPGGQQRCPARGARAGALGARRGVRAGTTGSGSGSAARSAGSATPRPLPRRAACPPRSRSRWRPARSGPAAGSPPTGRWHGRTWTWSCTSATTPTSAPPTRRWPTSAPTTRSTRPHPTCGTPTRRPRSCSPSTTTRSITTGPATPPSPTARHPTSRAGSVGCGPTRSRPTTSTCRCAGPQRPNGASIRLHRRLDYGRLARFHVLDTRQYRTDQLSQAFPGGPLDPRASDPGTSLLGDAQERWLFAGLRDSPARWNVLAQQTIMAQVDDDLGEGVSVNYDQWDGCRVSRERFLSYVDRTETANPVVLSGDWHSAWVNDLRLDFDRPETPAMATEFVGTSISSGCGWADAVEQARPAVTDSSWVVENGRPGAQSA